MLLQTGASLLATVDLDGRNNGGIEFTKARRWVRYMLTGGSASRRNMESERMCRVAATCEPHLRRHEQPILDLNAVSCRPGERRRGHGQD